MHPDVCAGCFFLPNRRGVCYDKKKQGERGKLPLFGQKNAVRHAASILALTALLEYALNILLFPLIDRYGGAAHGTLQYELLNALLYLAVFVPPFAVLSVMCGWKLRDLIGAGRPHAKVFVMTVCLTVGWNLIATFLAAYLEAGLNRFGLTEGGSDYTAPVGLAAAAVMFVSTAIVPPIVEELCYRGFFLKVCRGAMSTWAAILLTACSFWIAHSSITILPLAVGFGIIGGVMRVQYDSLLPSMLGHFFVNGSYLLVNQAQECLGEAQGMLFSGGYVLAELLCLIVGIVLAVRMGFFRAIGQYLEEAREEDAGAVFKSIFTSIPFLLMLCAVVYLTARGLEAVG